MLPSGYRSTIVSPALRCDFGLAHPVPGGFIVTNMSASPEGVVHLYNGRGTAEQWIKEGKYALNWTTSQVRLYQQI